MLCLERRKHESSLAATFWQIMVYFMITHCERVYQSSFLVGFWHSLLKFWNCQVLQALVDCGCNFPLNSQDIWTLQYWALWIGLATQLNNSNHNDKHTDANSWISSPDFDIWTNVAVKNKAYKTLNWNVSNSLGGSSDCLILLQLSEALCLTGSYQRTSCLHAAVIWLCNSLPFLLLLPLFCYTFYLCCNFH